MKVKLLKKIRKRIFIEERNGMFRGGLKGGLFNFEYKYDWMDSREELEIQIRHCIVVEYINNDKYLKVKRKY